MFLRSALVKPLSVLLVISLVFPAVAQATTSSASRRAVPALTDLAPPAPLALAQTQPSTNHSEAAIQTPVGRGRLLLAPAIDSDNNPATNPTAGTAVPVVDWLGIKAGMVSLAVQVEPDDPDQARIGVPVDFSLWRDGIAVITQTVRSDAWGAASLNLPLDDVTGEYTYQASAPGYGVTEVRRFRFDPANAFYTVHADGAELTLEVMPTGIIRATLHSSAPMLAERDEPRLVIARRPELAATSPDSLWQPVLQAVRDQNKQLPFPSVVMAVVDSSTAQIDLQLPPGQYLFLGSLDINGPATNHYFSQPEPALVTQSLPAPAGRPIWVGKAEHDAGKTLVRYDALAGQAAFDLVDTARAPQVSDDYQSQNVFVKQWRTGAFEWQQEIYDLQVDVRVDDGKKRVSLADFDYDPLSRRYQLAIESLQPNIITDTLHVEVYGPGDVVILRKDAQVTLRPGQILHYDVEVPAELGRPYGLRVVLEDPLDASIKGLLAVKAERISLITTSSGSGGAGEGMLTSTFDWLMAKSRQIASYIGDHLTVQLKLYVKVFEADLVYWGFDMPPDEWHRGPIDWIAVVAQVGQNIFYQMWTDLKVVLGTGGFQATVTLNFDTSPLDVGDCPDPVNVAILQESIVNLAYNLNQVAEMLPFKASSFPPEGTENKLKMGPWPTWWMLMVWVEGAAGLRLTFGAADLALTIGGQIFGDISVNLGLDVEWISASDAKNMYALIQGINIFGNTLFTALADYDASRSKADKCPSKKTDPPSKKHPADDRQDVWQSLEGFYQDETYQGTIDNLIPLIEKAHSLGQWRAERYLVAELRDAEQFNFASDTGRLLDYMSTVDTISEAAINDLQAIISGTLPISPSLTITQALVLRNEQAVAEMRALPYLDEQQALLDAVEIAQQHLAGLYGEELELQHELRRVFFEDTIGVITSGFPEATAAALRQIGLPVQLISPWDGVGMYDGAPAPYIAPGLAPKAVIVPTGGMHLLAESPEARAWLEAYVAGGGLLLVFTQAFGTDWQALPGGNVRGIGYEEDQRCEQESVRAAAPSNWLVWMGDSTPDVQVDGVFTAWPADATPLLLRTSGFYAGLPAMIEYPYGAGRVLATSAYGDWAAHTGIWWGDDWQMTRALLIRAYLLQRGQDVQDLPVAASNSVYSPSFPIANSTAFTVTSVRVTLPLVPSLGHGSYAVATLPLLIAPGSTAIATPAIHIPPASRGIHNWTRVGLFRLRTDLRSPQATTTTWGSFLHVPSPIAPPQVSLTLAGERPTARPNETLTITATVRNFTAAVQDVVLRGVTNLPNTPIPMSVPPGGAVAATYTVVMDQSKNLVAKVENPGGQELFRGRLLVNIGEPNLQAHLNLPDEVSAGTTISVTVSNQPTESSPAGTAVSGTLALEMLSPTGVSLWTAQQPIPVIGVTQSAVVPFTVGPLGDLSLGVYTMAYRIFIDGRLVNEGTWEIPSSAQVVASWSQPEYRVRDTVAFTAILKSQSPFALNPMVAITAEPVGASTVQTLTLPARGIAEASLSFTLPVTTTAGSYIVQVDVSDGMTDTAQFSYTVPRSVISAIPLPPERAVSDALGVLLINSGGQDTTASYSLKLIDARGVQIAVQNDSQLVPAGGQVVLSLPIPDGPAAGTYWLWLAGQDSATLQPFSLMREVALPGVQAALEVQTDQPAYLAGDTVAAMGAVTATQGTISGTLRLEVVRAEAAGLHVGADEHINPDDEPGYAVHADPRIVRDAAGNAYAVWTRSFADSCSWTIHKLYFQFRPAGGAWGPSELVDSSPACSGSQMLPEIALDGAGNAYVVWRESHNLSTPPDITYLRVRSPGGTWGARETLTSGFAVNGIALSVTGDGTVHVVYERPGDLYHISKPSGGSWSAPYQLVTAANSQSAPDLAVDGDTLFVVWTDGRSGNDDIYSITRSDAGVWSLEERVNSTSLTAHQRVPSVAVDGAGAAYVLWEDYRVSASNRDIYFSTKPAGGAWSADVRVGAVSGNEVWPEIGVDSSGNATALWRQSAANDIYRATRPAGGSWSSASLMADGTDTLALGVAANGAADAAWLNLNSLYGSQRPAGGAWSAPALVFTPVGGADQYHPSIGTDATGTIYAVWRDKRNGGTYTDLYYASRPPGGAWSPALKLNTSSANVTGRPHIVVLENGDLFVIFADARLGTSDVFYMFRPANGGWSAEEQVNDVTTGNQWWPALAVDDQGNAYAAWNDLRNGSTVPDLYFSMRPAGGAWTPSVRVNDVVGKVASNALPDVAVDSVGNVFVSWTDTRTSSTNMDVYSDVRPAGGAWGVDQKINDLGGVANSSPFLAVASDNTLYAAWDRAADIRVATRAPGGVWSASEGVPGTDNDGGHEIALDSLDNVYVSHMRQVVTSRWGPRLSHRLSPGVWETLPLSSYDQSAGSFTEIAFTPDDDVLATWEDSRIDGDGVTDIDSYLVEVTNSSGDTVLWSKDVAVSTSTTQAISETIGALASQPGRYVLHSTLRSSLLQHLGRDRAPFYIHPAGLALTLATDQEAYRPGETITVSGVLSNTAALTATVTLHVQAGGSTLINQPHTLPPGASVPYQATTSSAVAGDLFVEAAAGAAQATATVIVANPQGEARLDVPAVAGRLPFSATVVVSNTGSVDADVLVSIDGLPATSVLIQPGDAATVGRTLTIDSSTVVTASVGGDLTINLSKPVAWGEGAALALLPLDTAQPGQVSAGYVVTGTGTLPTDLLLVAAVDGGTGISSTLTAWPGQVTAGSLLLDLPAGRHQIDAALHDADGDVIAANSLDVLLEPPAGIESPKLRILDVTVTPVSRAPNVTSFDVAVTYANDGPSGVAAIGVQAFDAPLQVVITPTAYTTATTTFNLPAPADLPRGDYTGQVIVGDTSVPFSLSLAGAAEVDLALALDQPSYEAGDMVSLTATLHEQAGIGDDYHLSLTYRDSADFITVTVPANTVVQHTFVFTATETGRASVALSFTPQPGEEGQRTLMIDSLPVQVVDPAPGAYLTFDQAIYEPGQTIHLTAHVLDPASHVIVQGPQELLINGEPLLFWTVPISPTSGASLVGEYPLSFTLPSQMNAGQYTFVIRNNGQPYRYPVDVRGWNVTSRRVTLNKTRFAQQDELAAKLEFLNESGSSIDNLVLRAWVYLPEGEGIVELTPPVNAGVSLQPGLNVVSLSGILDTPVAGPHRLWVTLSSPNTAWNVASAIAQVDVGQAHLVELTTDQGIYAVGEPAEGRLDVYGFGPTTLVVTATTGATLLNTVADLAGFETFTFAAPTPAEGDYLLVARSVDVAGTADTLIRAYAVPPPRDEQLPSVSLTDPAAPLVLTSSAPSMMLTVSGVAADDSGVVHVLVGGEIITPTLGGGFSTEVRIHQGYNFVSAVAYDATGNYSYTPAVSVFLVPQRGIALAASQSVAQVGDPVAFQAVVTATRTLSDVLVTLPLASAIITNVVVTASSGQTAVNTLDPAVFGAIWQGNVPAGQPVTVTVAGTVVGAGTLTATASALWGDGLSDQASVQVETQSCVLPADFDGNGVVDIADLIAISGRWGQTSGSPGWDPRYDLRPDGAIDIVDLQLAMAQWEQACS